MAKKYVTLGDRAKLISLDDVVSIKDYPNGNTNGILEVVMLAGQSLFFNVSDEDYQTFISEFSNYHTIV